MPIHVLFPLALRAIWLNRNCCVFYNSSPDFSVKVRNVINFSLEWTLACDRDQSHCGNQTVLVSQVPPPVGLFKLNTDGSFDANLSMGLAGGLIRDSSGNWVLGFQRKDVVASSSTACWALKDCLQLALERNLLIGILAETDSLTLVHLLNQIVLSNHELCNIISDCMVLLDQLKAEVCHVDLSSIPNYLIQIVLDDARGRTMVPGSLLFVGSPSLDLRFPPLDLRLPPLVNGNASGALHRFIHPIVYGEYPKTMQEMLGHRLPQFTNKEVKMVKGSMVFVGVYQYTAYYIQKKRSADWSTGMDDPGNVTLPKGLHDTTRKNYYKAYITQLKRAIDDGANVEGYFAWSLLDNFEWRLGYTSRFGIVYVDYKTLKHYPKMSAYWFEQLLSKNKH
ncbi:hypothetical protein RHGRI_016306 [Rhododendron griersonianum]|uniref:RNase H type-1 domain-containing protein n=1 Tax=Rhododendron griersonianum TaxID=479676 RepID=A0AAV6JTP6_9ERIC|nr:hypothetical protein RHGRI_016306 [Rhododendron griersonianum]